MSAPWGPEQGRGQWPGEQRHQEDIQPAAPVTQPLGVLWLWGPAPPRASGQAGLLSKEESCQQWRAGWAPEAQQRALILWGTTAITPRLSPHCPRVCPPPPRWGCWVTPPCGRPVAWTEHGASLTSGPSPAGRAARSPGDDGPRVCCRQLPKSKETRPVRAFCAVISKRGNSVSFTVAAVFQILASPALWSPPGSQALREPGTCCLQGSQLLWTQHGVEKRREMRRDQPAHISSLRGKPQPSF